jgi:hypothetical protein
MSNSERGITFWALLAGAALGFAILIIGLGWSLFVSPSSVWSESQAAEYKAANDALHAVRVANPAGEDAPEVIAARRRFDRISSQLESARSAHDTWGTWIAAIGLAVTFLCGVGFLATRRGSD